MSEKKVNLIPEEKDISHWMCKDVITAKKQDTLYSIVTVMNSRGIGAVVITEMERIIGILSERDILKQISSEKKDLFSTLAEDIMTKNPLCIESSENFTHAFNTMYIHNIRHLIVAKNGKLEGIVSLRDLLRYYQNKLESELLNANEEINELKKVMLLNENDRLTYVLKELEKTKEKSVRDGLTGLYNHRYFSTRLEEEEARAMRHKTSLSVIFADIDFFKKINDSYGHDAGDSALRMISGVLSAEIDKVSILSRLRKSDIVARYGGEEFVIILPETKKNGARIVAEKLRKLIENLNFTVNNVQVPLSMSFGIASMPEDAGNKEDLIRYADEAMYHSKRTGRNKVSGYGLY